MNKTRTNLDKMLESRRQLNIALHELVVGVELRKLKARG